MTGRMLRDKSRRTRAREKAMRATGSAPGSIWAHMIDKAMLIYEAELAADMENDELVERAAKALYEASLFGPRNQTRVPWSDTAPSHDYFVDQARIAVEAALEVSR